MATNSKTYARAATDQVVKDANASRASMPSSAKLQQTAGGLLQGMFGRSPAAISRQQDAVYGDLARTLTEPRGPAAEGIPERLLAANRTSNRAQSIAGGVPYGMLTQGSLLSLVPTYNQGPR